MTEHLASGFQSVDRACDFTVFSRCVTLIDSLPFSAECTRESYDLLDATPGRQILEVGCGLGDDAASIARRVAPGGSVIAVDGSHAMTAAAGERHAEVAGLSFEVAHAAHLPFDDASFAACRIDRVLQHITGGPRHGPRAMPRRGAGGIRPRLGDPDGRLGRSRDDAHRPERFLRPPSDSWRLGPSVDNPSVLDRHIGVEPSGAGSVDDAGTCDLPRRSLPLSLTSRYGG